MQGEVMRKSELQFTSSKESPSKWALTEEKLFRSTSATQAMSPYFIAQRWKEETQL